jgi:chromosomal replication initiator protein
MNATAEKLNIWDSILKTVEKRLNRQIFDSWFLPIQFEGADDSAKVLRLKASEINRDWINSYYTDLLKQTMTDLGVPNYTLDWNVVETMVPEENSPNAAAGPEAERQQSYFLTPKAEPKPAATQFPDIEPIDGRLNQKYKFDTFVVGSCNQFAHAAALGAAEAPGKTYNPLFLYGGVGLGKTHLMHAIGHSIKEREPHLRIAYISLEKFMNELINAIRYDKTQVFRDRYRSIDVLLMDDVQFIAGKERTQEEFFHTFNALYDDQKQLVISSDCPPREIPTLEERLHSRFEWGLIADIEPPDLETKIAILKRKADIDGITLPDDVALYIASKVKSNIRELEGSLVRLVAISSLRGLPISRMLAQDAIRTIVDDQPQGITINRISQLVAEQFRLSVEELKSKNNSRHIAVPRQVAMYLCKKLTRHSFPEIGREFGGKHHTTVMHSVDKITELIKQDTNLNRTVSSLTENLCS